MRSTLIFAQRVFVLSVLLATGSISRAESTSIDYVTQPWGFNIGGGYSPVVGGMNSKLGDGWNFAVGLGYKLTEKFGLNLEYMNQHLGVDQGVLNHYSSTLGGIDTDGNANVWSVTLNPKLNFELNDVVGGYVIGGGGYYHVKAQLTTPGLVYMPPYCDYYWGCWPGGLAEADRLIGERKDDTGGVNVGFGLTFNIWESTQFYLESRYHYVLTDGPNLQLFPFTAGFRF